jgi:thiosulfate reductase cytochrome b subunit
VGGFFLGMLATLFLLLILAMFCFGPQILEWLEDMPGEPG